MTTATAYFNKLSGEFAMRYQTRTAFRRRISVWRRCLNRYAAKGGHCFDAGCGPGSLTQLVLDQNMSVFGVDASREMIKLARDRYVEVADRATFVERQLPISDVSCDSTADLIICSSVLEYIGDIESVVRDFYRILKPGGILLSSLPNRQSILRKVEKIVSRAHSGVRDYLTQQRHQFTVAESQELFRNAGFVCESHEFFGMPSICYQFGFPETLRFCGTMILVVVSKPREQSLQANDRPLQRDALCRT